VRGADHLGASLPGRFEAAMAFVASVLDPPPPDTSLETLHATIAGWRAKAGL
jgi:hypothetical protein